MALETLQPLLSEQFSARDRNRREVKRGVDEALQVSLADYFDYTGNTLEFLRDYFSLENLKAKARLYL